MGRKKYLVRKHFPTVSALAQEILFNFYLVVHIFSISHFVHIKFIRNKQESKND